MKYFERAIALTALVITVMVSSTVAFAQERQTLVNIPFNFTVGDKALPAGEYLIRRNRKDADTVWAIQHKDSGKTALFLTRQVHSAETQEDAKFVFHKYDDLYFLAEFWTAGTNTGREIQVTDRERAMQKALAVAPTVHVLIDRGGR
jgi:hypothetical protein